MGKVTAVILLTFLLGVFSPVLPMAHAAFIEEKLAQVIEQDPSMTRIQEIIKIKNDLEKGSQEALWGALARTVLERAGYGSTVGILPDANINQTLQTAIRGELEQSISSRLSPYQKELAVVAMLLNWNKLLQPQAVQDNDSLSGAPQNYKRILDMTATAYAPGALDNGIWKDKTYMGGKVHKGVVAVDPNVIPMGTKLWVEGYGEAAAEDQGSAIRGNRIDLAFDTRTEALAYGIQKVKVYVLN